MGKRRYSPDLSPYVQTLSKCVSSLYLLLQREELTGKRGPQGDCFLEGTGLVVLETLIAFTWILEAS